VGFSRAGTLKRTTADLVRISEAGRTHPELEQIVRVRVHNTLLDLVEEKEIGRERLGGLTIYVSPDKTRSAISRPGEHCAAMDCRNLEDPPSLTRGRA